MYIRIYATVNVCAIFYRHHSWCSFEAAAEIYNEFMRETLAVNAMKSADFVKRYPLKYGKNAIVSS